MRIFSILFILFLGPNLSAQSGITWSATTPVASANFGNMHPRVVVDGIGNPMIIWGKSSAKQVFFSKWSGNGFTTPISLNPANIPVFAASWAGPDIASKGDTVYVVFKETPEDASGIYIVRSVDGGQNFEAPERVDAIGDSISRFPAVGVDENGQPLVAFMKFNPGWGSARYVLAKSEDLGNTFGLDVLASRFSGGDVCDCCPASVVASNNTVALMYRDNLNNLRNSWAGISFDGGNSFNAGIEVDNTDWMINACPSSGPDGVIIGDSLYSVFMSAASGKALCYRSRSTLSTQQMESITPLTSGIPNLSQQNFPRLANAGNAMAIVWVQTIGGSAQLALQFTNNVFSDMPNGYETLVSDGVMNADIALSSDGKIHVVWEDVTSGIVQYKSGTFMVSGIATQPDESSGIKVYPNPTFQSELFVQFDRVLEGQIRYEISNTRAQTVRAGFEQLNSGILKMNVSNLPQGIYWIRVVHQGRTYLGKVVIA